MVGVDRVIVSYNSTIQVILSDIVSLVKEFPKTFPWEIVFMTQNKLLS